jgi:hypothetical protein
MKNLFLTALFFVASIALLAQAETYSKVRISLQEHDIHQISRLGISLDGARIKNGQYLEAELSQAELNKLTELGVDFELLIPDMSRFYQERFLEAVDRSAGRNLDDLYPVPQNWEYGSMGGFYTYDEVMVKLDFMAAQWPDLISVKQQIPGSQLSHEGRPIWYLKISDNPNQDEDEPEVLYTSLIHAREGIGVQQMIYFMLHLLENYETNEEVRYLVDNTEMYFVPVVNPDGYIYNQTINPSGGGMWRKNRRINNGGSFGVDINRNFGYMWGIDNEGSSGNPDDLTYRGPAPFSEPETSALKILAEQKNFMIALNYHSYSDLLLYPWGYTSDPCPDDDIFFVHAGMMTRDNNYVYGAGSTTIYPTNGGSDDWMYGDTESKNKIFSYTPEVGDGNDGFWPQQARIIPLCQENMYQNILAAYLAGSYGKLTETSAFITGETTTQSRFDMQRVGFAPSDGWVVSIVPLDNHIISVGDPVTFGSLEMLEVVSDSIGIVLNPEITSGTVFRYLLSLDNGSFVKSDTITRIYGKPSVIFEEYADNISKWSSPKWNITTADFVSPFSSITDSPGGNYSNNETNIITMVNDIEIPETPYALLSFWAKWNIEPGYDYVQVQLRKAGTTTWIPLEGKYTKPGSSNQAEGQPLYDGVSAWVKEEIDLTPWAGESIRLRFRLVTDVFVTADGYYFDDLTITIVDTETSVTESNSSALRISVHPNPAKDQAVINLYDNQSSSFVTLMDVQGRILYEHQLSAENNRLVINTGMLQSGLYIVRVRSGQHVSTIPLTVER